MVSENGLIDEQPRRSEFDHVVAKTKCVTIVAIGSAEKWLVDADTVIVGLR